MTWMVIWCPFLNLFHQQRQLCDPLHGSREEGLKSLICLHFQCLQVPLKVFTHFPGESVEGKKWEGCRGEEIVRDRGREEGTKVKSRIEEERKRKRGLHGDTNMWLTHSSLVLLGDVSGLHSSVHSTQTCSQPTIGGSKLNYSMYKDSLSIKYTPTCLLDECRAL